MHVRMWSCLVPRAANSVEHTRADDLLRVRDPIVVHWRLATIVDACRQSSLELDTGSGMRIMLSSRGVRSWVFWKLRYRASAAVTSATRSSSS